MARNKVILARLANDNIRKSTLRKRRVGLLKKIEELSTLCEVESAVVVYAWGEEEELVVWPSQEVVEERLRRYEFIPGLEKTFKMTTQETYLQERVTKETDLIEREEKKNDEKENSLIMNQLADDMKLNNLYTRKLNAMYAFAADSLKKLKERSKKLECSM